MSADERRETVLEAAMREFAFGGLYGTSAEVIANRAGISQPYLFRLFGTKKELFLDRLLRTLEDAVEGPDSAATLASLNRAYAAILADREVLLAQVQVFAACSDDEVRFAVRRRFAECYRYVERVSDATEDEVRAFFADSMLQTVAAAMRLDELAGREPWARRVVTPPK
jgi:AcrR family transcriptional regulator